MKYWQKGANFFIFCCKISGRSLSRIWYMESASKFVNISMKSQQKKYLWGETRAGCQFMKKQSLIILGYSSLKGTVA